MAKMWETLLRAENARRRTERARDWPTIVSWAIMALAVLALIGNELWR